LKPLTRSYFFGEAEKERSEGAIRVCSTDDFDMSALSPVDTFPKEIKWLPYAVDIPGSRLMLTGAEDFPALLDAPFFYQEQFQLTRHLLLCPIERVSEMCPSGAANPEKFLFVFSIGRCGSTMLSMLFKTVSLPAISEPDIFSELALKRTAIDKSMGAVGWTYLAEASTEMLAHFAGLGDRSSRVMPIKFRSQVNLAADRIAAAFPQSKFVFILRQPAGWFRSMKRAFGVDVERGMRAMNAGLQAIDCLSRARQFHVVWYEDIVANPGTVLSRIVDLTDDQIAELNKGTALAEDSQSGTRLARSAIKDKSVDNGEESEFLSRLKDRAPKRIIDQHGLKRLIE
jgi:hypothetical protein